MEHSKSLDDRRCGPDNGRLLILSCIKETITCLVQTRTQQHNMIYICTHCRPKLGNTTYICTYVFVYAHMCVYVYVYICTCTHILSYITHEHMHMPCHMCHVSIVRARQCANMLCYNMCMRHWHVSKLLIHASEMLRRKDLMHSCEGKLVQQGCLIRKYRTAAMRAAGLEFSAYLEVLESG
jgi:hypothetical protein